MSRSLNIYTIPSMNVIYGINSVAEALKARGRAFEWVGVAKERHDLRLQRIIEECRRKSVAVRFLPRQELDRMASTGAHQGVVAVTSAKQYTDLDDLITTPSTTKWTAQMCSALRAKGCTTLSRRNATFWFRFLCLDRCRR